MFGITSPKAGLKLLKKTLEKQLCIESPYLEVMYIANENKIDFIMVDSGEVKKFKYEDESTAYADMIKASCSKDLKEGCKINVIRIYYSSDECYTITYYVTPEGEKKFIKEKLK